MARAFSVEDTNLSKSLIASRGTDYKDIDLAFAAKPAGDVFKKTDAAAVKQAVKNLLLTNRGEKPFQPNKGSRVNSLLFEPLDPFTADAVKEEIINTINQYEPRVELSKVIVTPIYEGNKLNIFVEYRIVGLPIVETIEFVLQRPE